MNKYCVEDNIFCYINILMTLYLMTLGKEKKDILTN